MKSTLITLFSIFGMVVISCKDDSTPVTPPPENELLLTIDSVALNSTSVGYAFSSYSTTISNQSHDSIRIEFTAQSNTSFNNTPQFSVKVGIPNDTFYSFRENDPSRMNMNYTLYAGTRNYTNEFIYLEVSLTNPGEILYLRLKNIRVYKIQ